MTAVWVVLAVGALGVVCFVAAGTLAYKAFGGAGSSTSGGARR